MIKTKDKSLYKQLCYAEDRDIILNQLSPQKKKYILDKCFFSIVCKHCRKDIPYDDFATHTSYWHSYFFPVHNKCLPPYAEEEKLECQLIDADCNDCSSFVRGQRLGKQIYEGDCLKKNIKVKAYPCFCSAHSCFIHRSHKN